MALQQTKKHLGIAGSYDSRKLALQQTNQVFFNFLEFINLLLNFFEF